MLPLWANFPKDKNTFKTEDSFMVGNGLLVYPVTEADINQVSVYFPGQNTVWYDIRTFAQHNGSETVLINVDMESVGYRFFSLSFIVFLCVCVKDSSLSTRWCDHSTTFT